MKLPALKEIVEERKSQAIESLSVRFAENRLPLEEYERLVEYINKIESERELFVVEKIVAEYGGEAEKEAERGFSRDDFEDNYGLRSSMGSFTILSSRVMTGPVAQGAQFITILGSGHVKIRKVDLRRRRTNLQVLCLLGDSVIQVESGIRVTNMAVPVLGEVRVDRKVDKQAGSGGPELVVGGVTLLGTITVRPLKD